MENYHEYTWETLFHFLCGECSNWWSYAGFIEKNDNHPVSKSCPHCGYKTQIHIKKGFRENG